MVEARTRLGAEAAVLLAEYLGKIERCMALLTPEQVWWRANPHSNSAGNLLLHLAGNLSQWLLDGLGGKPYQRHRSTEFAAREIASPEELVDRLRRVALAAIAVAQEQTDQTLAVRYTIQGYKKDGIGVLLHAVEHMAYHTGQIVLLAKQLGPESQEIEFYPHLMGT